jgi:hypothetical protein
MRFHTSLAAADLHGDGRPDVVGGGGLLVSPPGQTAVHDGRLFAWRNDGAP